VIDSLSKKSLQIDQVLLKSPFVSVIRDKQANFNFTDLLTQKQSKKTEPEAPTNEAPFPITIELFSISEGKISWIDKLHAETHYEDIYPLNLNIKHFTTIINEQSNLGISLEFASGGQFDWQGNIQLNPFKSSGHIELNNIGFHKIWQLFLQDEVNFSILKGSELIKADYQLSESNKMMQLLINNAELSLLDIQLAEKGKTDSVISIPHFKVSGISLDLLKQSIEINKISSEDARFKAWLNKEGSINYQSLFASKHSTEQKPPSPATTTDTHSKPWNVLVKQLEINNFAVNFTDKTLSPPNPINLTAINLSSSELSTKASASLPFNLTLNFNKAGKLAIKGHTVLEPFKTNLQLNIADIALKDFQPYINQFARLNIISGLFNVTAKVALNQQKNHPMAITFKGNSHIDNLHTRDTISNKDFVNWKKLSLNKIDLDIAANQYIIDTVRIDRPYARVLIRKNKTININDIAIKAKNNKNKTAKKVSSKKRKTEQPNFKIKHFVLSEGISDFSDKSLILPFSAHINHLNGSVKGISSDKHATIKVALNGKVANFSPVIIKGKITPSKGNSNFDVNFNSMPLPLMTPYMAEFAGRKIEKGNMSLNFQYKIKNNKLAASNSLLIDQLVLGDEVENPDAVSLPLGLAIALLQDVDGKIKLDVPITGDLDNPEFSVASIIVDALVNVITKIVTSPFSAIASLIGSDEDISKITFSAGNNTLNDDQREKLDNLAIALTQRPALKVEIKAAAYSEQDWPKMQAAALDQKILKLRTTELIKQGNQNTIPSVLPHSDKEYQRLLADLFIDKFPLLADRSLLGTPRLINDKASEFYTVAQIKLAALIPTDNQKLHDLAATRAKAIAKHLVEKEIAIERVFLLDVDIDPENTDKGITANLGLTTE